VQRLVPFGGPGTSGSSYRVLGTVFVHHDTLAGDTLRLAEVLVHETAHNRLFAGFALEPSLDAGDTQRYRTPLRPDARPILGLLHQVFVLARLVAFFDRARPLHPGAESAAREAADRLRDGHATLAEHARATPAGRELLASIGMLAAAGALAAAAR
jgi:HEXXH motif-containing protein